MAAIVVSMFLFLLPLAEALNTNVSQGNLYRSGLNSYNGYNMPPHWQPNYQYDFLQFVLQNPISADPKTLVTEKLTIHGLWPTNYKMKGPFPPSYFRGYTLLPELERKLNIFWPNVKTTCRRTNEGFREYEYEKHGSRTNPMLGPPDIYFETALSLYERARNKVIIPSGIKRGIRTKRGIRFKFDAGWFLGLITSEFNAKPLLLCGKCGASRQLDEVVICFDAWAKNPVNCYPRNSKRSCWGKIYL